MRIYGFVIIAVGVLAACASTPTENFARDSRKFGLKLYKTMIDATPGNMIISPISVQIALALLYAGADGNTARELSQSLHFDFDQYVVAENHKSFLDHHAQSGVLNIANKIYLGRSLYVLPQFSQTASSKFYSEAETIDTSNGYQAAQIVNSWVARKTNNKIQNLVSPATIQGARSVIVNTIHFKADWINPFKKESTYSQPFWVSQTEQKHVDMMHQIAHFTYADYYDFKVIKLGYKNTDISLVVMLPNEREGLRDIEARFAMDNADLSELLWYLKPEQVFLSLPKFTVEFSAKLEPALKKMGMVTMFSNLADFSKLSSEGVKVDSVIHQAVIEIDEKGTEAAAATAIMMGSGSSQTAPPPLKYFIADHPFFYFLIDINKQILFMGRYVG